MSAYDPNPNRPRLGSRFGGPWVAGAIIAFLFIIGMFYWSGSSTNTAQTPPTMTPPPMTTGSGATTPSTNPTPAAPTSTPATTPARPAN